MTKNSEENTDNEMGDFSGTEKNKADKSEKANYEWKKTDFSFQIMRKAVALKFYQV